MATHSSIIFWGISWTEETGKLQFVWLQKCWTYLATKQYIKRNKRRGTMYPVITGNMDVVRKILSKLTEITQLLRK